MKGGETSSRRSSSGDQGGSEGGESRYRGVYFLVLNYVLIKIDDIRLLTFKCRPLSCDQNSTRLLPNDDSRLRIGNGAFSCKKKMRLYLQ